jgi:phage-related protein (TIGR01555 family)
MFNFKKDSKDVVTKKKRKVPRKDGMYNRRTKIGTRKDNRMVTEIVPNEESMELYEAIYDVSKVAQKIVEIIPKDATREWIELVNFDNEEDKQKFSKELKRLRFKDRIYHAAVYSRLYGAGLLFIADGTSLSGLRSPLKPGRKIKNLILFNNYDVEPSVEKEININSSSFGMPLYYKIITTDEPNSVLQSVEIHHSRFIRIDGDDISKNGFKDNRYFNYGILGKIQQVIKDWESSYGFIPDIISKYNLLVLKMQGMIEVMEQSVEDNDGSCKEGQKLIQEKVDDVLEGMSALSMCVVDGEDDMEIKNPNNVSGMKDLYDSLNKNLMMVADVPHTRLFGESPIGSNATGNSTTLNWYDTIEQWQESKLELPIENSFELIAAYLGISNFGFVFSPLWQQTGKELAETRKLNAETDSIYMEEGCLSSEEVRKSRFGGDSYSNDTTINKEVASFPKDRRESQTTIDGCKSKRKKDKE